MKLITISGCRGAGKTQILKRIQEAFPIVRCVERNGHPFGMVQDSLAGSAQVAMEVSPQEARTLDLLTEKGDKTLRIFIRASLAERERRLREMFPDYKRRVIQAWLREDPAAQFPRLLQHPIFHLVYANEEGQLEFTAQKVIRTVVIFLQEAPTISI
ncbi:MAG: hypothetical protein FJY98_01805 [Candidatus Liptonbacteria bacterium]|nr:hypothetical protein [Candidatus Liptonbacteria bacterium]